MMIKLVLINQIDNQAFMMNSINLSFFFHFLVAQKPMMPSMEFQMQGKTTVIDCLIIALIQMTLQS